MKVQRYTFYLKNKNYSQKIFIYLHIREKCIIFASAIFALLNMIILNIETSTDACSAAITENGKVMEAGGKLLCRLEKERSEHAKQLPLMVEELLGELAETGKRVECVAVSAGPGSYTGLRIGASCAKGLAYGFNVPLVAVPTLQAMAAHATELMTGDGLLCPMIDARRMEVYSALYTPALEEAGAVEAVVVEGDSYANRLAQGKVYFFGNGSAKCKPVLTDENAVFLDGIVPDAAYMGMLAEAAFSKKEFADVAYWTPFYLKEFEAKHSVVKGLK